MSMALDSGFLMLLERGAILLSNSMTRTAIYAPAGL